MTDIQIRTPDESGFIDWSNDCPPCVGSTIVKDGYYVRVTAVEWIGDDYVSVLTEDI